MKAKIVLLSLLISGCASTPKIPVWYANPPLDTEESVYFVAKGRGKTEELSKQDAGVEGRLQLLEKLDATLEPIAEQYSTSMAPSLEKEKVKSLMRSAPYQVVDGVVVSEDGAYSTYVLFKYHLGDALFLLNIIMQEEMDRAFQKLAEEDRRKYLEELDKQTIRYFIPDGTEWNYSVFDNWLSYNVWSLRYIWDDFLMPYSLH